jgi:hypothetical protein
MDPAALGTTRIGLDGIRREQDRYDRGDARITRTRTRHHPIRHRLAAALQRAAASLDPAHAGAHGASASEG